MKKYIIVVAALIVSFQAHSGALVNWLVSDPQGVGYPRAKNELTNLAKKGIKKKYQNRVASDLPNLGDFTFESKDNVQLTDTEQEAINKATISIMQRGNDKFPQRSLVTLGITAAVGIGAALVFDEYQRGQREQEEQRKKAQAQGNSNSDSNYHGSYNEPTSSSTPHHTANNFHYHAAPNIQIGNTTETVLNLASSSHHSYDHSKPSATSENIHLYLGRYQNQSQPTVVSLPQSTFESLQKKFTDSHKVPHVVTAGFVGFGVYRCVQNIWIGLSSMLLTQAGLNFWAHRRNVNFLEKMRSLGNVLPAYTLTEENPPAYTPRTNNSYSANQIANQMHQANAALANSYHPQNNSKNPPAYTSLYADLLTQAEAANKRPPYIIYSSEPDYSPSAPYIAD